MKPGRKDLLLDMALLLALALFVYRGWFGPGIIWNGEWFYIQSKEFMIQKLALPNAWNSLYAGTYTVSPDVITDLFHYYVWLPVGVLAKLGFPFEISERLVWFWPVALGSPLFMYFYTRAMFRNRLAALMSAVL